MDLIERYLQAVRFWLPRGQQEDILAEIADDLRSQVDEREAGFGRPLTEDEVANLLLERGQPMVVAAKYQPRQFLISPAMLPVYKFILKLVILWILAPCFAFVVIPVEVSTAPSPLGALIAGIWQYVTAAIFTVGIMTIVFAIFEWRPHKSLQKWDPRKLPKVRPQMINTRPVSPCIGIADIVMAALLCGGWMWLSSRASIHFGEVTVTLAPIWHQLYFAILAICFAGVPLGWVTLTWPAEPRLRSAFRVAIDLATLVILGLLLNASHLIDLSSATLRVGDAGKWTNDGLTGGLLLMGVMTAIDAITEAMRIVRASGARMSRNGKQSLTAR